MKKWTLFMMNRLPDNRFDIENGKPVYTLVEKDDGRLFPEYLLYCEGMPRPTLRGVTHLICAVLYPLAVYHLYYEANGNLLGQLSAIIYLTSNLWCVGFSALFHRGRWSVNTEILLQKLDHCGIAIFSAGTNIPVCLLLLPFNYGFSLAFLSVFSCLWACWHIANRRPSVWRLIVVASMIAPFFPILYFHMSSFEFWCMIGNTVVMSIGSVIFSKQCPDPWPAVFGYHELFHICTGFGIVFIYLCNWSVIRRTCNPYAHITDVSELLKIMALAWLNNGLM